MSCNNCKRLAEEIELGTVTVENLNKDIIQLDAELDRVDFEKSQLQITITEQAEQIKHYLKVIQMLQEHNTGLLMKLKAATPQKGE